MKQFRFFLLSAALLLSLKSFSQHWEWAKAVGGDNNFGAFRSHQGTAICTDNSGYVYVAGFFSGKIVFGKDTLNSYMNMRPLLMKNDRSGNPVWARQITNGGSDYAYGVCIDPKQNVCITGIKAGPGIAVFTAEFNCKGKLLWLNETSGEEYENRSRAIVADKKGNFYVAGDCKGLVTFDTISIGARDKYTIYIAKYSPAGKVLWVRHSAPSAAYPAEACGLAIDNAGNLYLGGEFAETLNFEKTTVSSKGSADVFMAKFNSAGKLSWLKTLGGIGKDRARSIAVDANNNIYFTAYFSKPFSGNKDLIEGENLMKFNADGNLVWTKQIAKYAEDYLVGSYLGLDKAGNIFLTGYKYYATPIFGETAGTSNGSSDLFVAKCNPSGKLEWKVQAGGSDVDEGSAICVDKDGSMYVTGTFNTEITIGSFYLKSANRHDGIFVAKLR